MKISTRVHATNNRSHTYGFMIPELGIGYSQSRAVDAHAEGLTNARTIAIASSIGGPNTELDYGQWLPAAAEQYNISPNIKDYVIVPNIPIILSDVPNTNGIAFEKKELLRFIPAAGKLAYQTFKGKPTFIEHDNADSSKAKGVILDVYAAPLTGYGKGLIKVVEMLAFDRERDPDLCKKILSGERNAYSMGASFNGFRMSTGERPGKNALNEPLFRDAKGRLVYKMVMDVEGFETSSVGNPAYISALGNEVITM